MPSRKSRSQQLRVAVRVAGKTRVGRGGEWEERRGEERRRGEESRGGESWYWGNHPTSPPQQGHTRPTEEKPNMLIIRIMD